MNGLIGYYKLEDWWFNSYTEQERKFINESYHPLGAEKNLLIEGNVKCNDEKEFIFLANLSSWFNTKEQYNISSPMILESERLFKNESVPVLDLHFYYNNLITFYYKFRAVDLMYDSAKNSCLKQIEISANSKDSWIKNFGEKLPAHLGFKQLSIIFEKEKNYIAAIEISEKALREGWSGDWEKRLEKLKSKL